MRPSLHTLDFVGKVKPRHLDLLVKLRAKCPESPPVLDLIFERDRNLISFWDVDKTGLVLTQIAIVNTVRSLLVYATVGRGIVKRMPEIVEDLKVIAKEYGCSEVSARPTRKGWSRVHADKLGFVPRGDLMVLEIS